MTLGRILAIGARSPLGLDARGVALGLRAQKLAPRRLILRDDAGASYGTARAVAVADDVFGFERLVQLSSPALHESLHTTPGPRPTRLPLHLAVGDPRPDVDPRLGRPLLAALAAASGDGVDLATSTTVAGGHAGFGVALERALTSSRATGLPAVAGAVDTYHDQTTLRWLAKEHRLHGPGVTDGFIPSEGAAFAVVSADPSGPRLATIRALELAADECDESADDPPIAVAMTSAIGRALDAVGAVAWMLVDVNGERHRVKEWSFVSVRHRDRLDPEVMTVDEPYREAGDAGAATGALFTAHVCMAWDLGFAPHPRALVALRSDGPGRAVVVLEAP